MSFITTHDKFQKILYFLLEILCNTLNKLPIRLRRLILLITDSIFLVFSYFISLLIALNKPLDHVYSSRGFQLYTIFIVGLLVYLKTNQYKGITRFSDSLTFYNLLKRNLYITSFQLILNINNFSIINNLRIAFIFYVFINVFTILPRILVKRFFIYVQEKFIKKVNFAIFGVKNYKNTPNSIFISSDYELSLIIDDSEEYINRTINSISIVSLNLFLKIFKKNNIKMVVIRSSDFDTESRLNILNKLNFKGIEVVNLPHIGELKVLNASIENLQPISINDLLGRPNVLPDKNLLKKGIDNLSVCITGAGGSIGSEICSQLIKLNPRKLILIEQNEYSLYLLLRKLDKENTNKILIKGYLGSACDFNFIYDTFKENQIEIVFHAAAYKHVPLVEENPIYGISNNIFSTKTICEASHQLGIKKVILISTDKAVRPTNIMGASKRVAELILKTYANDKKINSETIFSMVRFGNVLGSSGSVIPLFKEQIKNGGPITLTHENIYRYFMTIAEAANLVIQSSAIAESSDLFLLDMGKPVSIFNLAKQMIILSGLKIKDKSNPKGDIEIKIIGLRNGEKLYEELLIEPDSTPTQHPLIYKAIEKNDLDHSFWIKFKELEKNLIARDELNSLKKLKELVPEWKKFQ